MDVSVTLPAARGFKRRPLDWLDATFSDGRAVAWINEDELCVADADAAKAILANRDGGFEEHSDFFSTRSATFGPRANQVEIGVEARALLERQLAAVDLARLASTTAGETRWPETGCRLAWEALRPAVISPERPKHLRDLVEEIVDLRIFRRRPAVLSPSGIALRFNFYRAFERERASAAEETPADVIAVLFKHGRSATTEQLMELFVSFVFSAANSVGLALAWTVYLTVRSGHWGYASAAHLVREALRLYPVAWLFPRRPRETIKLGGEIVSPQQRAVVSPFAVHRNPRNWQAPRTFMPERWESTAAHRCWIPFGYGQHSCIAAELSVRIAGTFVDILRREYGARLHPLSDRPSVAASLAPPTFSLTLGPR